MQWLIFLLLGITSGIIFYQDLKSRSVTWLLFPAFAICGLFYSVYRADSLSIFLRNFLTNVGFLVLQFLILKIAFHSIIGKAGQYKTQTIIGLGDILLLVGCALFFSPINFIIFYSFSLLFALLFHLLFKSISKEKGYHRTIPLAGIQAVLLFIYTFLNEALQNNLTTDDWIVFYLYRT